MKPVVQLIDVETKEGQIVVTPEKLQELLDQAYALGYTDGVNEAENKGKELFGEERLVALLKHNAFKMPGEIIDETFAEVRRHADGAEQSDDITVMCLKYC